MTREEKKIIYDIKLMGLFRTNHSQDKISKVVSKAIKALEQEPCEDAIRRADAEALFRNARSKLNPSDYKTADEFNTRDLMLLNAEQFIHLLPSVRPQEPKTGHWGRKTKVDAYDIAGVKTWGIKCQCDRCSFTTIVVEDFGYYKYCPNCGCRMEGEE